MKRLLMLFVVLSVLSTLCTGITVSRALCEKIPSCKQRTTTTSTTIEPTQEPPEMIKITPIPRSAVAHFINTVVCPGGAHKLRSGTCAKPSPSDKLTWSNYDDAFYGDE